MFNRRMSMRCAVVASCVAVALSGPIGPQAARATDPERTTCRIEFRGRAGGLALRVSADALERRLEIAGLPVVRRTFRAKRLTLETSGGCPTRLITGSDGVVVAPITATTPVPCSRPRSPDGADHGPRERVVRQSPFQYGRRRSHDNGFGCPQCASTDTRVCLSNAAVPCPSL